MKKDFNKRWVSSFEISVNFNYLPQFSFRICPDVCFLCGFCSNLHVPPMLVCPTSKKGSDYFQRAQTHATQQSNKPFYRLFWVFLGKLWSVKVFLGVFLVCWRLVCVFCLVVVVEWLLCTTSSWALFFGLRFVFGCFWRLCFGCAGCGKLMLGKLWVFFLFQSFVFQIDFISSADIRIAV